MHRLWMLSLLALASPVAAQSRDACLVGRWPPFGNGAAEWLERAVPGMRASVPAQSGVLELRRDGTFAAHAATQGQVQSRHLRGDMQGRFASRGTWRGAGGHLDLVPDRQAIEGRLSVTDGARRHTQALPQGPVSPTAYAYTCAGAEMTTRMRVPGSAIPLVQRYRRLPARDAATAPPARRAPAPTTP
jgi:hypothetical protein